MIRLFHRSVAQDGSCVLWRTTSVKVDLVESEVNGICLCQGNFTLMTDDLPSAIRQFGKQQKIFFVHFRDVRGTPVKFEETFHDEGQTAMHAGIQGHWFQRCPAS